MARPVLSSGRANTRFNGNRDQGGYRCTSLPFAAAGEAFLENDAATIRVLPMITLGVFPQLPIGVQVPVVLSVWTNAGEDFDPHFFIKVHDPDDELRGQLERIFHWPDIPGKPYKYQVFTEYLQFLVFKEGFYRVGLYDHPDQEETDVWFPLEVFIDPSAPPPGPPPPSVAEAMQPPS